MNSRVLVGLAAPQVGVSLRIILVDMGVGSDRKDLGDIKVFINPEILSYSEEQIDGREGCFSVDIQLCGIVPQSQKIKYRALDRMGNPIEGELTDFTARIFQHEVDHLEGMCFPDRLGNDDNLHWVKEEDYEDYRNNWQNWPYKCQWKVWQNMKEGLPYEAPY